MYDELTQETTRLIAEVTSYVTIRLHKHCATVCGLANSVIILLNTLAVFFLKLRKRDKVIVPKIRDLWTLVKNCEFFSD